MLARFERLLEHAVEGSLRRVFPTTLQPVQLAKAAARAMEQAQVVGLRGPEVPNHYVLRVAPADLVRFGGYTATLSRELSHYLEEYARERGLRLVAGPSIELVEDARVRSGSVRAEARFVDLPSIEQEALESAAESTRRLRLSQLARSGADAAAQGTLWLTDRLGLRFPLDAQVDLVRVGRAPDNDLVLANQRVSRYHAQLRRIEGRWLIYDLDSTNGTFVDHQRVGPAQPAALRPGQLLRLADHELRVADSDSA